MKLAAACGLALLLLAASGARGDEKPAVRGTLDVLTTDATQAHGVKATVEVRRCPDEGLGLPVAGAALHSISTGPDGRGSIADLPPGSYEVRAFVPDTPATRGYAAVPPSGGRIRLRLDCGTGPHTLEGRAIWRDGRPFRGWARIERPSYFFGAFASTGGSMVARTDENGRFTFRGLPRAKYKLGCTSADGSFDTQHAARVQLPLASTFVYVVDERGARLDGTVLDATGGTPIPGAVLRVSSLGIYQPGRARTDDAGNFNLSLPDAYTPELLVEAPGFAPQKIPLPRGESGSRTIRLGKPGRITGRVLRSDGETAAAGARIYAVWRGEQDAEGLYRTTQSGADGRFSIDDAIPGPTEIFVLGGGWATAGSSPWDEKWTKATRFTVHASTTLAHDLRVVPAATADIVATWPDGKPVLACGAVLEPNLGSVYEGSTWDLPDGERSAIRTADRHGHMVFRNLIPGVPYDVTLEVLEHRIEFTIPPTSSGKVAVVERRIPKRRPLAFGTREAPPPLQIAGTVAGPAALGRHLVELLAQGIFQDGTSDGTSSHVTTHAPCGGAFVIEGLEEKRYLLTARVRWKGVDYEAKMPVDGGQQGIALQLVPRPPTEQSTRFIRVVDAQGRPVPRAQGWLDWSGLAVNQESTGSRVHGGLMEIAPPPGAGSHVWIDIVNPRGGMGEPLDSGCLLLGPIAVDAIPDPLRLPSSHWLAGTVTGPDGKGVADVWVLVLPLRPKRERRQGRFVGTLQGDATTDAKGRFAVRGLGPGPYQLSADPPVGFAWPDLVPGAVSGANELRLRLQRAVTKRVRIVDDQGKPLRGARLRFDWRDSDGRWCRFRRFTQWGGFPWTTTSIFGVHKRWTADDEGYVTVDNLHPTRAYLVSVEPPEDRKDVIQTLQRPWTADKSSIVVPTR